MNTPHSITSDAQGNIYVGDRGNARVQVFDNDLVLRAIYDNVNVGTPTALCMTPGPRQCLYVAHTGDADGMDDAAIYKVDLGGKVVGKFGRAEAGKGIRSREFDRLPQRERAPRR